MLKRSAFTLVEILVGLSISLIVFGIVVVMMISFMKNRQIETTADTLVTYLRVAVDRSSQSEGNTTHGVSLVNDQLVLFRGASYASRQPAYDSIWSFPGYIDNTGISEVVFSKQAAVPSVTGDIVFDNGSRTITTTIYSTGAISQQ